MKMTRCVCYWSYKRTLRQYDTYSHCTAKGAKHLWSFSARSLARSLSLTYTCSNTQTGVTVWQCMCNTLTTKRRDQGHYYCDHSQARFIRTALFRHSSCVLCKGRREKFMAWNTNARIDIKSWENITITMQTQLIKKLPSCVNLSSHLNFALCLGFSVPTL